MDAKTLSKHLLQEQESLDNLDKNYVYVDKDFASLCFFCNENESFASKKIFLNV